MRRFCVLLLAMCLGAALAAPTAARDVSRPSLRVTANAVVDPTADAADPGLLGLYESAAVDTYCLVWYTFEQMNWQGWTRVDNTAQRGTFWHVDDFAGLGGGSFGRLTPLEGTKSMWCGVRANPSDPYMCSWATAPGYGNDWAQDVMAIVGYTGLLRFSYKIAFDVEPDYDVVRVEYFSGGWLTLTEYTGRGDATAAHVLPLPARATKLRFHFTSDGAYSDQDGRWNTDGACIVDSITIADDTGLRDFQNFESATVGATSAGRWTGQAVPQFGMYSGLKSNLVDKDPCNSNFATQIVYFIGSPDPTPTYPWPGLYVTPFCKGAGGIHAPCQDEMVVSPLIDMTKYSSVCNNTQNTAIPSGDLPLLGGAALRFNVYRDLPRENLVFYEWHVRQWSGTYASPGCPGPWLDRDFLYYGPDEEYVFEGFDVSDLVGGTSPIQIAIGVHDMCDEWYLLQGTCAGHTPAPWIDQVRFYRYKTVGPQWSYRDIDLFQDNFPELEYDLESFVMADAANDINTFDQPDIRPGDSIVVDCSSLVGGGIASGPGGVGPAVYLHVKAAYIGPAPVKPNLAGASLAGSSVGCTFPYVSDDGTWTVIQCDTARTGAGIVAGKYCVDLNDALFTRGYMVEYYFTANDNLGAESALPRWARSTGPYFEFTCLPTKNSEVLFVDDCGERGGSWRGVAESYWVPTFRVALPAPDDNVDIYDVNGPTSGVSNGPGSRAKNRQLTDQYYAIVWDSGDLESVTISDGTTNSDKSNDCGMLTDWMDLSEHRVGLWVCGDDIAYDLHGLGSAPAVNLMASHCGVDFAAKSYYNVTGGLQGHGIVNPLMTGATDLGLFIHTGVPDKFYLAGGCPGINEFDVLAKTAGGQYAVAYPTYQSTSYYGGIGRAATNSGAYDVKTMWFGFSWQYVRSDVGDAPLDRFEIARDVFAWFQFPGHMCCGDAETPGKYALEQNYPNPFNPSTTIKYDMKTKGLVTVKIYNVAGELVRTLVDGMKDEGSYSAVWDGRNNLGAGVASGIYFYRMETAGFSATKKLVLLR